MFSTHIFLVFILGATPNRLHSYISALMKKKKRGGKKKKKKTNHKGLPYACYNMVDCSFTPCVAHKSIN